MNFVILGNVCIDHNRTEKTSYKAAGGPITFMSIALRQLPGTKLTVISSYGKDFLPYKDNLHLYPRKPNVSKTLVYENIISKGKRTQKAYYFEENLPVKVDSNIMGIIRKADVLFITPLLPNFTVNYLKKITSLASKKCIKILLPQGYFRNFNINNQVIFRKFVEANKILPLVDYVILSSEDYPEIEKIASGWVKRHNIIVIVTQGENGALIISEKNKLLFPTVKVTKEKIVDSIGAGDIFGAGFGYRYLQTNDIMGSVSFANRIARQSLLYPSKKIKINFRELIADNHD